MGKKMITYMIHKDDSKKYRDFYQTSDWRKLSLKVKVESYFICQNCWDRGLYSIVRVTHHKDPIRNDSGWVKRLDPSNLEALCNTCHERSHNRQGGGSQNKTNQDQKEQIKINRAATIDGLFSGGGV